MRSTLRLAAWLILVVALAAGGLGLWTWYTLQRPFQGYPGAEITLEVPTGQGARAILDRLERVGVLANAALTRLYLVRVLGDPPLKAGEYRFRGALTAPQVLRRLIRGEVVTHLVTLVEGLTLEETAARLAEAGFGEHESLVREMRSTRLIEDLDPEAEDLEGYLFPDTYAFARGTPEGRIVEVLIAHFRRQFQEEIVPLLDVEPALSPRQVVILASLIETEAQKDEERPLIAAVYANRLRRGMGLYADPTIIYALKKAGRWDGNLRRPDLELDSPYNTYLYPGLPPGPIASPGLASLQAAAQPADAPYLYFVSRNDGTHVFATTLAEHNRNVYRWQKLYWRRRWAEERKEGNSP